MKRIIICALVATVILTVKGVSFAAGVGIYLDGGGGKINWTGAMKESGIGGPSGFVGGGLIVDTCLAKARVFNYRMNFGYSRVFSGFDFNRINFINTFGFAVLRTNLIRLWLGPQFGMRYAFGKFTYQSPRGFVTAMYMSGFVPAGLRDLYVFSQGMPRSKSFKASDIHAGLALGVNVNLSGNLTLFVEAGFKIGTHIMSGKTTTTRTSTSTTTSTQLYFNNSYMEGYVSAGMMYRVNEPLAL